MPWRETCAMDERLRFIVEAMAPGALMSAVCGRYGISRKTGYKWLSRYRAEGLAGLTERSRAPGRRPWAISWEVAEVVLSLRRSHPTWGPRKLRAYLQSAAPETVWPSASTIGELLQRHGLVRPRGYRRRTPPMTVPFGECTEPNDVWCADFKGWFRTGDGRRCEPLTVTDAVSRYALVCQAVARTDRAHVQPLLEDAFRRHGLPGALRTDNGPPFASRGLGGLSRLAVWLAKLGVRPERIRPGKPQENGRHERFHRTLKHETAAPPAPTLAEQQARFDAFTRTYNQERPHEALGQVPPARVYGPSPRVMPDHVAEPVYPDAMAVRRVRSNGEIKWRGQLVFLSEALVGEPVGLADHPAEDGWIIHFADLPLAHLVMSHGRPLVRAAPPASGFVDNADAFPTTPPAQQPHTHA